MAAFLLVAVAAWALGAWVSKRAAVVLALAAVVVSWSWHAGRHVMASPSWHEAAPFLLLWAAGALSAAVGVAIWLALPELDFALEVVDYDPAEGYQNGAYRVGLEQHFDTPGPRETGVPGMWRGGLQLLGGLVASDLAFAAGVLVRGRARWRNRGCPATSEPAPVGHSAEGRGSGRGRYDGRRYDDQSAA